MREKLTLVTDFASLKAGDYVLDIACDPCGKECRGLLVELVEHEDGHWGWRHTGPCSAGDNEYSAATLDADCVGWRRIYLIDTGFESSEQQRAAKRKRSEQPKKKVARA